MCSLQEHTKNNGIGLYKKDNMLSQTADYVTIHIRWWTDMHFALTDQVQYHFVYDDSSEFAKTS